MELNVYAQIGILLGIATIVALIMRVLRQPLIIGHIITGFIVGRFALELFSHAETLKLFSELGISFLLFSVGLTLNPKVLKEYGLVSVLTGFGQVFLTGAVGWIVCTLLGYNAITSLYVGIALAFSSTVIVMKLLSDKGDLDKLYVKLSIGSLLIQDVIAIVLLFVLPFTTGSQGTGFELVRIIVLGALSLLAVYSFTHFILKPLHPYLTRSHELLFLFAISWGMGVSALFAALGFSLEGGALIAGIALSTLPSRHEIGARLAPLKDFFIVTFFITLGTTMVVSDFQSILVPAIVLSLFVLIGNPLLQLIIMGWMGYRKKTSFQTGTMAAQISEFSLILVALGVSLGQVKEQVLSMVTLVGIITIFASSYLILYSDKIYKHIAKYLTIFERKNAREKRIPKDNIPVILIGGSRIGYDFIELFRKEEQNFLVLDHDPDVLAELQKAGIKTEYGDANDPDLLEELKLRQAELIVSTVPQLETNLVLLSMTKPEGKGPYVIVVAHQIADAIELYDAGADYVIMPHFLGGTYAAKLVKKLTSDALELQTVRATHIKNLNSRLAKGHEHPVFDRTKG
jgi:Kef-type K+ transport system membrane component KefB/Trk K+ transport system NAD-binding subunit